MLYETLSDFLKEFGKIVIMECCFFTFNCRTRKERAQALIEAQ